MLIFNDKNASKKRIKELEESLLSEISLKGFFKHRVEQLESEANRTEYRHSANEKRWAEQLESYEEKLKQRDSIIAELKAELNMAGSLYESVNERWAKTNKSLGEAGNKLIELESINSHLREELHDAVMELNGRKPSKSPYPTVIINVDAGEVAAKALASSLKQANEAFKKQYKKKYVYTQVGASGYFEYDTLDDLLEALDSTYWIKEVDLNSLREEYESLEETFNEEGKAYTTLSFFSIEYNSRIRIMTGIKKEDI